MRTTRPQGLLALRHALAQVLDEVRAASIGPWPQELAYAGGSGRPGVLWSQVVGGPRPTDSASRPRLVSVPTSAGPGDPGGRRGVEGPSDSDSDHDLATSSAADSAERERLIALVELARGGDKEAFGLLYDHYHTHVFRFLYYRLGSVQLAEDLTSETFFRALRSMSSFRWQGRDFGAWLTTIARNLTTDHFKSGRNRLEQTTEDLGTLDSTTEGPEDEVLSQLTNEALLGSLRQLPQDQQDCLVLRFLQGKSLAETAEALGRTPGAIKQLQLRAVRNLAKLLPEGIR